MATNKHRIYPFIGILFILVTKVSAAGFDFTCTSNQPLLDPGDGDNIVTAFPAGNAAGSSVTFSRAVDTRNGNGLTLPADSRTGDHPSVDDAKRLIMESTGGKERIGIFYCEATKGGTTYKIPTIILHETGDPAPVHKTVTANPGDSVTLEVTITKNDAFGWYKDGLDNKLNPGEKKVTFVSVTTSDAGFYECAIDGERARGTQAMIRLIVRECAANQWSRSSCDQHCPICYNGGVCDDKSGACICGAGFGGTFCELTYGQNTFGQDGTFVCASGNDDACRGKLLCQLDPYGCSCTAGYHGLDCDLNCNPDTFGADCKQTCHCSSGTCDGATGECKSGVCADGWRGSNCQVCEAIIAVNGLTVNSETSSSLTINWHINSGVAAYIIQYQLINFDQCNSTVGAIEYHSTTTKTSVDITGLLAYSTYRIYFTPIDASNCEGTQATIDGTTGEIPPSGGPPSNVGVKSSGKNSLEFFWDEVPCGSRGGRDLSYDYQLSGASSESGKVSVPSVIVNGLDACTSYYFRVRATNTQGNTSYTSNILAETDNEAPGAVTSLAVSPSQNSFNVTWIPPSPPCADNFRVSIELIYKDQCDDTTRPKNLFTDTPQTVITITDLIPYSTYTVYVQSINSQAGTGEEEMMSETTGSAAPTASPTNVRYTSKTSSIDFAWNEVPCGSRGGVNSYEYIFNSTSGTSTGLSVSKGNLIACSNYTFKVRAVNDKGKGEYTTELIAETEDEAPGDVTALSVVEDASDPNSLHVSWRSPDPPCAEIFAVYYQLIDLDQCDTTGGDRNLFSTITDTSTTVNGLKAHSTYDIYVISGNSKGSSGGVKETGTTEITAPTEGPSSVIFTSTTTSIDFTWTQVPCGSRGGSIISYTYMFDSQSGTSDSRSQSFNQLTPCSNYTFKVLAVNGAGEGPYTLEMTANTKDEVPGEVSGLSVTEDTFDSISLHVTWTPPDPPCAEKFAVYYQLVDFDQCDTTGGDKTLFTFTSDTSVTVRGLHPYSTYDIYVSSGNSVGDSDEIKETGTTKIRAPLAAPANIVASDVGNTSLTFRWERVPYGNRGGPNDFTFQMTDSKGTTIAQDDTSDLTVDIDGLIPCSNYLFRVKAFNDAGQGQYSDWEEVETDVGVLGPVQVLTSLGTTSTSVTLIWDVQVESLCSTDNYFIEWALMDRDQCQKILKPTWKSIYVPDTNVTIAELEPHSTYQVRVYPVNDVGFGKVSDVVTIKTNESAPSGPPTDIDSISEKDSITFSWEEPTCGERDGVISSYRYTLTPGDNKGDVEGKTVTIEGLNPCTDYELRVRAINSAGEGKDGMDTETTQNDVPFAPRDLSMSDEQKTLIAIKWEEPNPPHCPITKYTVSIRAVHKPYDEDFTPPEDPLEDVTVEKHFTFRNLEPCTEHEIKVYAHTESGIGPFIVRNFSTLPANEEELGEPVDKPKKRGSNATTITIQIPQLGEAPSPFITEFKVLVQSSTQFFGYQIWNTGEYEAGSVPKSQVKHDPYDFIVGSGNPAENIPLNNKFDNFISIGTCSVIGEEQGCVWSDTIRFGPAEPLNPASYIVPIIAVVLVAVLLGFIFIRQQRRAKDDPSEAVNMSEKAMKPSTSTAYHNEAYDKGLPRKPQQKPPQRKPPGPVKITDLAVYMRKKRVGDDYSFRDDFTLLPQELLHSYDAAKCEENRVKNRYANIATYDHSRVLLSIKGNDPHSDYINASHIDGYKHENQFIATQGPNEASIPHFWRMIWEQKITKIVMLTNLIEKNKIKCQQYWPKKVEKHETISVTLSQEEVFPNYTIRTFTLINDLFEGETLTVYQFHYTTWPDMDVPNDEAVVLKFMDLVDSYNPELTQPVVVHCSAGVGRTGAFIAIQSLKKQAEAEGQIDVFKFITDMRHKRMKMIQTAKQYKFIYDALIKHCVFGDTAIPVSAFHEVYMNMKTSGKKKGKSALDTQYQILQDLTALPKPTECSGGTNEENINKNRFHDIIPADNCRPYLMAGGEGMSNYINASFIDNGIKTKDAYVTTQMPMPNTIGDIWRAAVDYKCSTFVMLNQLDPNDQTMAKYWPDKGQCATHGPITVECKSERETDKDVTTRIFQLRHKQTETTVVQFCLNNWQHDSKVLPDPEAVMNLALKVVDRMSRMAGDRVLVHCIDGMGVSGTFCAIVSALERIVEEQVVDIFQTAKTVRLCNPRAIQTKDQYRFVYEVIQANLNSSQVYENYVPN